MNLNYKRTATWRYGLVTCLIIGLVVGLNRLSLYFDKKLQQAPQLAPFLTTHFQQIKAQQPVAISIGGSIGESLHFADIGINGVNLSFTGQDILENEAVLDAVLALPPKALRYLFLAIEPTGIVMDKSWSAPYERRKFYRAIHPYRGWQPVGHDWRNLIQGLLLPLARADYWRPPVAMALHKLMGRQHLFTQGKPAFKAEQQFGTLTEPEARKAAIASVERFLAILQQARYYHSASFTQVSQSLMRICDKARQHQLELIIYVPPITDIYQHLLVPYQQLKDPYWTRAITHCNAQGARLLDFNDAKFAQRYDLFWDTFHLNEPGAHLFSQMMKERLVREHLYPATQKESATRKTNH